MFDFLSALDTPWQVYQHFDWFWPLQSLKGQVNKMEKSYASWYIKYHWNKINYGLFSNLVLFWNICWNALPFYKQNSALIQYRAYICINFNHVFQNIFSPRNHSADRIYIQSPPHRLWWNCPRGYLARHQLPPLSCTTQWQRPIRRNWQRSLLWRSVFP